MSHYLVHVSRERARFRHPIFMNDNVKLEAMELLKKCGGVVGLKPGVSSILVFMEPDANPENMCKSLEDAIPQLLENETSKERRPVAPRPARQASGNNKRQILLKTLLASGVATVGLAAVGMHHLHALAGGVFAIFATHHVWERRKRI